MLKLEFGKDSLPHVMLACNIEALPSDRTIVVDNVTSRYIAPDVHHARLVSLQLHPMHHFRSDIKDCRDCACLRCTWKPWGVRTKLSLT
jgi:hypothetical protein